MGMINQPSGQIRLTNVSMVRLKKERKRFEIACYQNKVQDYRKGIEKDLDEVLQIHQVFMNVSKGLAASKEDLQKCFNTTDIDVIIKEILNKGEIQLSEKERQVMANKINNEMLTIISAKCVNPVSRKRYPPTMIHKALNELKYTPVINKPAKTQALEAIRLLVAKQIIPIARAKMKVKVSLNLPDMDDAKSREVIDMTKNLFLSIEESTDPGAWVAVGIIDPMSYRDLVACTKEKGVVQVLDMAVIDN